MDWDGLNTAPGSSHPQHLPWISHGKRVWEVLPSRWEIRGRRVSPALGIFSKRDQEKGWMSWPSIPRATERSCSKF